MATLFSFGFKSSSKKAAAKNAAASSEKKAGKKRPAATAAADGTSPSSAVKTPAATSAAVAAPNASPTNDDSARCENAANVANSDDSAPTSASKRRRVVPSSSPPAGATTHSVGDAIEVYWPKDDEWYGGKITSANVTSSGATMHRITYDDGDQEWLNLAREKTRMKEKVASARPRRTAAAAAMKRLVESDDDDDDDDEKMPSGSAAKKRRKRVVLSDDEEEYCFDGGDDDEDDDDSDDMVEEEEKDIRPKKTNKKPRARTPVAKSASSTGTATSSFSASFKGYTPLSSAGKRSVAATPLAPPSSSSISRASSRRYSMGSAGPLPFMTPTSSFGGPRSSTASSSAMPTPTKTPTKVGVLSFGEHEHHRLPWLQPDTIRDAKGRLQSDPGYDPSTLRVPEGYLKGAAMPRGRQQAEKNYPRDARVVGVQIEAARLRRFLQSGQVLRALSHGR